MNALTVVRACALRAGTGSSCSHCLHACLLPIRPSLTRLQVWADVQSPSKEEQQAPVHQLQHNVVQKNLVQLFMTPINSPQSELTHKYPPTHPPI